MADKISLFYTAKPISYEKINEEFTKMRCYVLATGKNRNFSYIGKSAVDEALPTIFNIPVVAHIKKKDDGSYYIGGHDRQLIIDNDGITVNDLTVPFGVVPETNNLEYVNVSEEDGSIVEYLVCDIILWTGRYGEIMDATYSDEIYFGQSMEIIPSDMEPLEEDKNYQNIKSFTFDALCLLGKSDDEKYHTEPCFPSCCVKPTEYTKTEDKFTDEFSALMERVARLYSSNENITTEKGGGEMEKKLKLLEEYGLTQEELDFEIDELSVDEMKEKASEFLKNKEEQIIDATDEPEKTPANFSATYNQKREAIRNALMPIITKDESDDVISEIYFWVADFDDKYVYVERSEWTESDYNIENGRFEYSFDETTLVATIGETYEKMILVWLTEEENKKIQDEKANMQSQIESIQEEFNLYVESHTAENSEVEELRSFKAERLASDKDEAIDAIFSAFNDKLTGIEEYDALKADHDNMDIQSIEDKCYSILGRKGFKFSATAKNPNEVVRIPAHIPDKSDDSYGGLVSEYRKKNNK
jgi:hypothetical protein